MKKKSSIIKLSIIGVLLIVGLIFAFTPMEFGNTTYKSFAGSIKLGLDLKGGVYAVYEMDKSEDDTADINARMEGTRTRLENLLLSKSYSEATVVREGSSRLRVEVPDVDDPQKIFEIIGKPATLEFIMDKDAAGDAAGDIVITGKDVKKSEPGYDTSQGQYTVDLNLTDAGAVKFEKYTSENQGKTMSIVVTVDDERNVLSSPTINSAIAGGKAVITMGSDDKAQAAAKELSDQITSGQFEVKLSLLESSTISPTLGQDALKLGIIAGIIGVLLVMIFMCLVYRMFGGVATVSLLIYTVLLFFFLSVIPGVQLTLPGLAGIILGFGMAVDANVIIYERIKDEYRNGKSILASYYSGFKKAFWAIFDGNITTIIAAIVLWIFGTGSIKGFAITLLISIIISMITAVFITRYLLKLVLNLNSSDPKIYGLKRGKNYQENGESSESAADAKMSDEKTLETSGSAPNIEGGLTNETI